MATIGLLMSQKTIAEFEPFAWWCARNRARFKGDFGSANDLPPQLLLLVRKLDKSDDDPQSSWIAT